MRNKPERKRIFWINTWEQVLHSIECGMSENYHAGVKFDTLREKCLTGERRIRKCTMRRAIAVGIYYIHGRYRI